MRIYYDEMTKNIVLGSSTRLFASGSLVAAAFSGRVSVVYKATNFREILVKHDRVLREDGSPAGATLQAVVDYLNAEFEKSPFDGQGATTSTAFVDGGTPSSPTGNGVFTVDFGGVT